MAASLKREFPQLHLEEVLSEVWVALVGPGWAKAVCPWGAARDKAERALKKLTRKPLANSRVRAALVAEYRSKLAVPGADAFLEAADGGRVHGLWVDLFDLLVLLAWPRDDAGVAVGALMILVSEARGKVSPERAAAALRDSGLREGLRAPLGSFVFAEDGYMQARMKGVSSSGALQFQAVEERLRKIIWVHKSPEQVDDHHLELEHAPLLTTV